MISIPAGVYQHYKGGFYQVLGIGQHTENNELLVIYIALTGSEQPGPRIRVRPLEGPNGFLVPPTTAEAEHKKPITRFRYVGNEIPPRVAPPARRERKARIRKVLVGGPGESAGVGFETRKEK